VSGAGLPLAGPFSKLEKRVTEVQDGDRHRLEDLRVYQRVGDRVGQSCALPHANEKSRNPGMASIRKEIMINVSPDDAWAALRDWGQSISVSSPGL